MTDEEVHAAIVADPDARPTDENFWKSGRVVRPRVQKDAAPDSREPRNTKTREELQQDIKNYIAARRWYRERVQQGNATDDDLKRLEQYRDLAVEARRSGISAPAFE